MGKEENADYQHFPTMFSKGLHREITDDNTKGFQSVNFLPYSLDF